uniref:Uncharacterized protein n=1 Tax=Arundo donax TaxID=35708 RepID=A0A0A9CGZ9_ARUDO
MFSQIFILDLLHDYFYIKYSLCHSSTFCKVKETMGIRKSPMLVAGRGA